MKNTTIHPIEKLSSRESEVLELIGQGYSREKIANSMCISKLTYDSYRKNIRMKLDIKNQLDWAKIIFEFNHKIN